MQEGVGSIVVGNGVVVVRGEGGLTNLVLHDRLEPLKFFNYSMLLCYQVREVFSIYRPTISIHDFHESVQGWNPATNMKIKCFKTRLNN